MSDTPLAIGIDFGGTSVKTGVLSRSEVIDDAQPIDTQQFDDAEGLIQEMAAVIGRLQARHPNVAAVGVGVPGFVDFKTGLVHNVTNVKGWQRIPLTNRLEELTELPVTAENDANCMAYAEWKRGSGRGMTDLVALTLGTGVGGGLVVNNRMVRGAQSVAGELGQTSIHYAGRPGAYGNLGALEDYIGNREIAKDSVKLYAAAGITKTEEDCTPANLSTAAREGDEIALKIWDDVAAKLSTAIMNCCWLLNPQAIIIGGGVAKAGPTLFDPLDKCLRSQLSGPFKENLSILPARFGNEAGIVGAATLALEQAGYQVDAL
ncbi:MAG: ROK family protein [Verrucomicrobiaceae bacterium]